MKINSLKKLNRLLVIALIFLVVSCGVGPKSNSNSQLSGVSEKFYTSFYKEEGSTVYYIKPIDFESDKEELIADITFMQNSNGIENVIINFSVFTQDKISTSEIYSLKINETIIEDFKILYNEPKSSKLFEMRYSVNYPSKEFIKNYSNLNFTIATNTTTKTYLPKKKTSKILQNIGLLFN